MFFSWIILGNHLPPINLFVGALRWKSIAFQRDQGLMNPITGALSQVIVTMVAPCCTHKITQKKCAYPGGCDVTPPRDPVARRVTVAGGDTGYSFAGGCWWSCLGLHLNLVGAGDFSDYKLGLYVTHSTYSSTKWARCLTFWGSWHLYIRFPIGLAWEP